MSPPAIGKKPARLRVLLGIAGLVILAGIAVEGGWRALSRTKDYSEAEPLIQTIWPMRAVLHDFGKQYGRGPASLGEFRSFAPDFDASPLAPYELTFAPLGKQRFFVQVNRRFAFQIDDQNIPSWVFTAVAQEPSQQD
jgi:hypothetical protein